MRPCCRALTAVAVALVAAGCAPASGTAEPPADDVVELSAQSSYGRHAAVRGKVDVRIANDGDRPVEVVTWQVRHPLFEVVPPAERPASLPPDGRRRIVPVPFGEPRCDAAPDVEPVVVLTVEHEDGDRRIEVPLDDGAAGLSRAHDLACAAQAVTDAVALSLAPGSVRGTGDDAVVRTDLVLSRTGPGDVAVTDVRGSVLLSVDVPARTPLGALPDGAGQARVPLGLRASRCETHALTESKTSFTFQVHVALDGGEPALVPVTATGPARQVLQALLDTTCGPLVASSG